LTAHRAGQPEEQAATSQFAARRSEVAGALEEVLAGTVPAFDAASSFVVTGVGASEGPARLYAAVLRSEVRARAEFVPLSAFYDESPSPRADALCIFSQGLSPNARLALQHARTFESVHLLTSLRPVDASEDQRACLERAERDGVRVTHLPPREERGSLVRVVGPAAASLAALALCRARLEAEGRASAALDAGELAALPAAVRGAAARVLSALPAEADAALTRPVAFVTAGHTLELHQGLRNKWLETLPCAEPPMWDVLGFVHGPLQEVHPREATIITLEREGQPRQRALFDRLAGMLAPERHTLVRLCSTLAGFASVLEHDAMVNELVLRALRLTPRDTSGWLGSDVDAPLYRIDS